MHGMVLETGRVSVGLCHGASRALVWPVSHDGWVLPEMRGGRTWPSRTCKELMCRKHEQEKRWEGLSGWRPYWESQQGALQGLGGCSRGKNSVESLSGLNGEHGGDRKRNEVGPVLCFLWFSFFPFNNFFVSYVLTTHTSWPHLAFFCLDICWGMSRSIIVLPLEPERTHAGFTTHCVLGLLPWLFQVSVFSVVKWGYSYNTVSWRCEDLMR